MYYKVNLRKNSYNKNTSLLERKYSNNIIDQIIVEKKLLSVNEVYNDINLRLLKRENQYDINGYFVLKEEINKDNIASSEEVIKYVDEFDEVDQHILYKEYLTKLQKEKDQKKIKQYLKQR